MATTLGRMLKSFWMDGDDTGRIECKLTNWDGIAYKIPRSLLAKCPGDEKVSRLEQTGAYFLFGTDEENRDKVYIGQTVNLLARLQQHDANKKFWDEAVVFTDTDSEFGPTEARYLESSFCELAKKAGRYEVDNGNQPSFKNVKPAVRDRLEGFINYAVMVVRALGYKVFVPRMATPAPKATARPKHHSPPTSAATPSPKGIAVHMAYPCKKYGFTVKAKGVWDGEKVVVLAGSDISPHESEKPTKQVAEIRRTKVRKGKLLSDTPPLAPSSAANLVTGMSLSGKLYWEDEHGATLEKLLAQAPKGVVGEQQTLPTIVPPAKAANVFKNLVLSPSWLEGHEAHGTWVGDGESGTFTVLAGSHISPRVNEKIRAAVASLRHGAKIEGNKLKEGKTFKHPSRAAKFVLGRSSNGWQEWRDENGVNLCDLTGRVAAANDND